MCNLRFCMWTLGCPWKVLRYEGSGTAWVLRFTPYKETEMKPLGEAFSLGSPNGSALSTQRLITLKARAAGTLRQKQQLFPCTKGNPAQCPVSLQTQGGPCNPSRRQPRFLNSVGYITLCLIDRQLQEHVSMGGFRLYCWNSNWTKGLPVHSIKD